jgi:hypothetical protein
MGQLGSTAPRYEFAAGHPFTPTASFGIVTRARDAVAAPGSIIQTDAP